MPRVLDVAAQLRVFADSIEQADAGRCEEIVDDLESLLDSALGEDNFVPRFLPEPVRIALKEMNEQHRELERQRGKLLRAFESVAQRTFQRKDRAEERAEAKRPFCKCCAQPLPGTLEQAQRAAKRQAKAVAR